MCIRNFTESLSTYNVRKKIKASKEYPTTTGINYSIYLNQIKPICRENFLSLTNIFVVWFEQMIKTSKNTMVGSACID